MKDPGLTFVLWTLVVLTIKFIGIDGLRAGYTMFKNKLEARIEEATRIYVETGEKTKDFRFLSYNNVQAAKLRRAGLIKERATTVLSNFEAYQECPSCRLKAHHHIDRLPQWTWLYTQQPMPLVRKCVGCGFKWIQK